MKYFFRAVVSIVMFPADFFHWTVDAWRMTLEGFSQRVLHHQSEQSCIYCRGLDHGLVPRRMCRQIPYWNQWMVKVLVPHLRTAPHPRRLRNMIVCENESGHVDPPFYIPLIALFTLLCWTLVILALLRAFGVPLDSFLSL